MAEPNRTTDPTPSTGERDVVERETAERETAERETAERETAERETAERETAERETAEREAAEREAAPGRRARAARRRRRVQLEVCLVLGLVGLAVAVRQPRLALVGPLWPDNAWLAATTLAPVEWLGVAGSQVPPGWAVLLSLVSGTGSPELLQLIPLALGALATIPAYLLGRRVLWRAPLLGGLACGLATALSPALAATGDLRQATVEGFAACVLLAALSWVEARLTWRRGLAFAVVGAVATLVASSAVLVLAIAAAALATKAASRRAWGLPGAVAVAVTTGTAALGGLLAWAVSVGGSGPGRVTAALAPPAGGGGRLTGLAGQGLASQALAGAAARTTGELELAGLRPWQVAVTLGALGVAALWRTGWPATAAVAATTWVGLAVLGALGGYPFTGGPAATHWSARTIGFQTTVLTLLATAGVAWLVAVATRRRGVAPQPASPPPPHP